MAAEKELATLEEQEALLRTIDGCEGKVLETCFRTPCLGFYRLWVCSLLFDIGSTSQVSVIIPTSLGLGKELGASAAQSGLVISSAYLLSFVSLPAVPKLIEMGSDRLLKATLLGAAGVHLLAALLYALAASPPWEVLGGEAWYKPRFYCLLASRMAVGVVGSCRSMNYLMVLQVTPKLEVTKWCIFKSSQLCLGAGCGPLLSSLLSSALQLDTVELQAAVPLYVTMAAWVIYMLLFAVLLPADLGPLKAAKAQADGAPRSARGGREKKLVERIVLSEDDEALGCHRQWIVALALTYGVVRAVMISSVEAATAMILETYYGYKSQTTGLMIGAVFVFGCPLMVLAQILDWPPLDRRMTVLSLMAACAIPLLFDFRTAGGEEEIWGGEWRLLTADSLIFPVGYMLNGVVDSYANQHAVPGTWASQDNYILLGSLTQNSGGRFLGPPLARLLIDSFGRRAYALVQLLLALLGCALTCRMRALVTAAE